MHALACAPFCTNRDWGSAAPSLAVARVLFGSTSMDTAAADGGARRAKRPRLEADRRRDMLEGVENKFADIDFTRYQYLAAGAAEAGAAGAGTAGAGRFVPVVPVPTAVVQNWRQLDSYERNGGTSYSEVL